jgi:hypothetical protein
MALRVQLVRSLHRPPTLLHADSGQALLCFTVPETESELFASSPPQLSRDVQASLSHAHLQDGHRTDGNAFLDERSYELSNTPDVFVAPEDLSIDSLKGPESGQHEQIEEEKNPFRYHRAKGAHRAERAIERIRRRTRQRKDVVKPDRAKERRRHVRQRSCDQFHVHSEVLQQL